MGRLSDGFEDVLVVTLVTVLWLCLCLLAGLHRWPQGSGLRAKLLRVQSLIRCNAIHQLLQSAGDFHRSTGAAATNCCGLLATGNHHNVVLSLMSYLTIIFC